MKTLEEIEIYLSEKQKENAAVVQEYAGKIQMAEQAKEQAEADLLVAEAEVDVEKYNKAKDAIWSAKHTKEFYVKQQRKLENEQLISEPEYKKLSDEILHNAKRINDEQLDKATELVGALLQLSQESTELNEKTHGLLHTLQNDVFKTSDRIKTPDGGIKLVTLPSFKPEETVADFYNFKLRGSSLALRAGETKEQSKNTFWA